MRADINALGECKYSYIRNVNILAELELSLELKIPSL